MTEQHIWNEARETAETLLETHGIKQAQRWVSAAIKIDTSKNSFWLRVWGELIKLDIEKA